MHHVRGRWRNPSILPYFNPIATPLHISPFLIKSIEDHRLLHIKGPWPNLASNIFPLLKYFSCITLVIREEGLFEILQACLANVALLKLSSSLKPNPPLLFESPIFDQLLQWILLSFCICPHQNLAITAAISLHNLLGSMKTLIEYVGIAWITVFNNISFLDWEECILPIIHFVPYHLL